MTKQYTIHWIVIYPVDRVIRSLNNQGLVTRLEKLQGSFRAAVWGMEVLTSKLHAYFVML